MVRPCNGILLSNEKEWTNGKCNNMNESNVHLTRVKEESEKAGLKLNIQKTKIMASIPITWLQINGKKVETVTEFVFLGSKITVDSDCSHKIKRHTLEEKLWQI